MSATHALRSLSLVLIALLAPAQSPQPETVSAAMLRSSVSFLASDLLEGRDTPSRGLDIAAAYIASEFRRANLESVPGSDYFQTANYLQITDSAEAPSFNLSGVPEVTGDRIAILSSRGARLNNEPVFKWAPNVKIDTPLNGKILLLRTPSDFAIIGKLAFSKPDAIVILSRGLPNEQRRKHRLTPLDVEPADNPVVITVPEMDAEATFDRLPTGLTTARASMNVPDPIRKPVVLRNVIGILRGSDVKLREQYLLLTAHYDHLGLVDSGGEHAIFNGANDNASGVATVIALAGALARENAHPRRTLVFMCFFGEEKGLLGSAWYVKHPAVPLAQTIADLNFEQMGETAKADGLPASSLGITGFDFTDLPQILSPALEAAGVEVREARHNAEFFQRSDNLSFAEAGIPAHTFLAALEYPDYHRTTDQWPQLNYENMAKLVRALETAIRDLANRPELPQWNQDSKKTREFVKAWRALHRP